MTAHYVLVHEICRHVFGYANDRSIVLAAKIRLQAHGFKGWKLEERDATDDELLQLIDGERCGHCTVDGNLRRVIR